MSRSKVRRMPPLPHPPYRIETSRTVVRCYQPSDGKLLKDAIDESIDHLTPWMPWVQGEPRPLEEKVNLCRSFRARFDLDEDYIYAILDRSEQHILGGTGLHPRRGPDAFEIGYWIRASATGNGYATEIARALTHIGLALCGRDRIEIRCDPRNAHSAAIPARLGYAHEATLPRDIRDLEGELRDSQVWMRFREDHMADQAAWPEVLAFGSCAEPLEAAETDET